MFALESPHRGDSNEYTQYTIFNIKRKITLNFPKSAATEFFQGTLDRVEKARVNEPSGFEPLKFYCYMYQLSHASLCNRNVYIWYEVPSVYGTGMMGFS